ncbi:thyroid transcription factor 1-associated protein 26 homolog [Brienomyrus brachyistius]|uniref:thyroid transcription factor 1-associated protein 26 homolog n=1 Tax=Brienomyrus brachyistius TaxID=42636 RepID=UPI0020B3DFB5|nr:thyroid transcription factor 1-associated protein 26 homolog [Brienomyrus brachyistius]
MAPINRNMKNQGKQFSKGSRKNDTNRERPVFAKNKRKWVPEHKVFDGSVQKGQGFAFKRKQKMQYEYKKLLRKERLTSRTKTQFQDQYPDHLKHLYLAEAEKLKNEEEMNRLKRRKGQEAVFEEDFAEDDTSKASRAPVHPEPASLQKDNRFPTVGHSGSVEPSSTLNKKKMRRKTSYQKTQEEYERIREKRAGKKEAAMRNRKQREDALKIYKEKKQERYKILSRKTRKGQPNLNAQVEYLLQKIQGERK